MIFLFSYWCWFCPPCVTGALVHISSLQTFFHDPDMLKIVQIFGVRLSPPIFHISVIMNLLLVLYYFWVHGLIFWLLLEGSGSGFDMGCSNANCSFGGGGGTHSLRGPWSIHYKFTIFLTICFQNPIQMFET